MPYRELTEDIEIDKPVFQEASGDIELDAPTQEKPDISDEESEILAELARRKDLTGISKYMSMRQPGQPEDVMQKALMPESFGYQESGNSLGYIEPLLTLGTGAVAGIGSGIAGIAKAITGGHDEASKSIEQIQEALTYQPKTEEGKIVLDVMGKAIKPVMDFFLGTPAQYWGDFVRNAMGENMAGDIAGTAVKSGIEILPDILGLKGTKELRAFGLKRILKDADISKVFDEAGNIKPDVLQAAEKVGLDANEVVTAAGMREQAQMISKAAKSKKQLPSERIAVESQPNPEILKAAEEFGVSDNLLASHAAENPTFRAIEQGLKSVPGSKLAARERALIQDTAQRADDLILEFGGTLDKSALSDAYKFKAERVIDDLEKRADVAYKAVDDAIPANAEVSTENVYSKVLESIDDLGGAEYLSTEERRLFNQLDPRSKPTYARLDKIRKEIGQALNGNSGPFRNSETGMLKQLYKALSEDQQIAAKNFQVEDLYSTAKDLVATRKGIENQLVQTLGKNLNINITSKAKTAMQGLSKGNTKDFDALIENIPEQVGPELRKSVISTALNDAFVGTSRAEKSLNIPAFDDFMVGLKRNKGSYERLRFELGDKSMQRLNNFHTLVSGIRRAQKDSITTGRIMAIPKLFDESEGLATRLYGKGKTVLPEVITTASGMPGLGTAIRMTTPKAVKISRSVAADELLASDKFRKAVIDASYSTVNEAKINEVISKIPAYKRWAKSLTESELADLSAVGTIGYLTGKSEAKENE